MAAQVVVIDNYDSFVYNLARYLCELGAEARVVRNDAVNVEDVLALSPQAVVVSPGPCSPKEAGVSVELIRRCAGRIPILGVCLGHQALAEALGGTVVRAREPVHGRTSWIRHRDTPLFAGVSDPFLATRYHSLVVDRESLPDELAVTAWTDDGVVMALEHRRWPLYGVQFHPESVLTQFGHTLLANFLKLAGLEPQGVVAPEWSAMTASHDAIVLPMTPVSWPGAISATPFPPISDLRSPTSDLRPPISDLRSPTSDLRPLISDL
jgi:anthranilate synthase/aminodeoxychorismate synthase-like glutamine amidotransferase